MAVTAKTLYCFLGRSSLQSDRNLYHTTDHRLRKDSRWVWACLAQQGDCWLQTLYWTDTGTCDRLLLQQTKGGNIKHSVQRLSSQCTPRMLSRWIEVTRYSPQTLAHAHLSHSQQGLYTGLWTVHGVTFQKTEFLGIRWNSYLQEKSNAQFMRAAFVQSENRRV